MIGRLARGLGLAWAQTAVTLAGQVLTVPVLLTAWGPLRYGEWLTLTNVAASISILNLGVQSYAGNRLIAHFVRRETDQGTRVLAAALRLYAVLSALAVVGLLVLVAWPGMPAGLRIEAIPPQHARGILLLHGLVATYALIGGLLLGLFRAANRLPRQLGYGLVERLVVIGAPLTVAALGGVPIQASLALAGAISGVILVELTDVRRVTPFPIGLRASWGDAVALLGPSAAFFVLSMAATVLATGMTVLLARALGPAAVVVFGTTLMLTNFLRLVMTQGLQVLWPEITGVAALRPDAGTLARWHRLGLKLAALVAVSGGVVLCLWGPEVLGAWTRGRMAVDAGLNLLLVLYLLVQAPALVSGVFGLATNRQRDLLPPQAVVVAGSLGLALVLIPRLGVRGAALALVVAQAVGTVWVLSLALGWTADRWASLIQDLQRGTPALAVAAGVTAAVQFVAPSQQAAFGATGAALLLILGVWWGAWLTPAERRTLVTQGAALVHPRTAPVARETIVS